jgi:hypothetical protein
LMNATLNLWFRYFVFNPENENEIKNANSEKNTL